MFIGEKVRSIKEFLLQNINSEYLIRGAFIRLGNYL